MNATMWNYYGLFFGGDHDEANTPIGDICTGYFVTAGDDEAVAREALQKRYAGLSGRFDLRKLTRCPDATAAARTLKRGGTKACPVLA